MESLWLKNVKRLHAIAETGLSYATGQYDLDRYREVSQIALELMSELARQPIERMEDLVSEGAAGYVTPKIDVRGAVFRDAKILLVREKVDGLWTLPGGFADLGLSPAENIEKEIREEAGIVIEASYMYSIRHKAKGEYDPDIHDFYKLFFLCEGEHSGNPVPGDETSEAAYFDLDDVPPLSTGRTVESDIQSAWQFNCDRSRATYFD